MGFWELLLTKIMNLLFPIILIFGLSHALKESSYFIFGVYLAFGAISYFEAGRIGRKLDRKKS